MNDESSPLANDGESFQEQVEVEGSLFNLPP